MKTLLTLLACAASVIAQPKPVPRMQALPLPHDEVSLQRGGMELCRVHFAADQRRPFIYPVNGPSGRSLTRMGHPHDPESHSHHNSVWVSHFSVGGIDFWGDRGGTIKHVRVLRFDDTDTHAFVETENAWLSRDGAPVLHDLRRITARDLGSGEWLLLIDLQLEARTADVTLGETAFGPIGVRMAKTIGVHDGGGTIRNSEGATGEPDTFRKPARWCDYSGPITDAVSEGIALLDHPANPHHPAPFHTRADGWMGASPTFTGPIIVKKGEPQRFRYALYVHSGLGAPEKIDALWKSYAAEPWTDIGRPKK